MNYLQRQNFQAKNISSRYFSSLFTLLLSCPYLQLSKVSKEIFILLGRKICI